jgi:hypothetical protein
MLYVLTREGPADDPRIREIHTPEEVVHPEHADGRWTARVKTGSASNALCSRRYGFALVETVIEPHECAAPAPRLEPAVRGRPATVATLRAAGLVVHDGEPSPVGPQGDWIGWQKRRARAPARPVEHDGILPRLRGRVSADLLQRAGDVARAGAWLNPDGEDVAIVLTLHGWADREREAVVRALDAAIAIGPKCRVVAIQNDFDAKAAFLAWVPRSGFGRYAPRVVRNDGFAAANNEGAKHAGRSAEWLLFTQADCVWSADAVRDAIGLARSLKADPVGFGAPAVVGPSGGYVDDAYDGGIREFGRNVARDRGGAPTPVDWIAGYWLLCDRAAFNRAKGWCERFFLYYEDPDLSLRLALQGCRPFAWPALAVEHERGGTIRSRLSGQIVSEMQAESRETFGRRWGGR